MLGVSDILHSTADFCERPSSSYRPAVWSGWVLTLVSNLVFGTLLCIYSNWNHSNLLDSQFCFNSKVWFHLTFHQCFVLMVILVSTLLIINFSVNSKGLWGLLRNLSKGLQSVCYTHATGLRLCACSTVGYFGSTDWYVKYNWPPIIPSTVFWAQE